jgi:hypothetical protein
MNSAPFPITIELAYAYVRQEELRAEAARRRLATEARQRRPDRLSRWGRIARIWQRFRLVVWSRSCASGRVKK